MTQAFPSDNKNFYGIIMDTKEDAGRILYKVFVPQLHGSDVKKEDLPFVPAINPANMFGSNFSPGAMNVGQLVNFFKGTGQGATGFGTITGLFHPVINTVRDLYGQTQSIAARAIIPLEAVTRAINVPPDLQKVLNSYGVEVTNLIEKGETSLSNLYGMATHSATAPLLGTKIPQSKNVPTAKSAFSSVLDSNVLGGLPGTNFSLSDLFKYMPQDMQNTLFANMPSDIEDALRSMVSMSQSYSAGNFGGAGFEGKRVDLDTFMANALANLKDVTDLNTLIDSILKLLTDSSLSGENSLFHFATTNNGFGNTLHKIGLDGSIISTNDPESTKLLASFSSLISGFQGTNGTVFDSVSDFPGMLSRLVPEVNKGISDVIESIKNSSPAEDGNLFVKD